MTQRIRAYAITFKETFDKVIALRSSKKLAINTCEDVLKDEPDGHWETMEKHKGTYDAGDKSASYEMFYVNE